jgi:hypothetical protein
VQTAAANTGTMMAVCCTIMSEGGFDPINRIASVNTGVAGRANLGAVRDEVLAIRVQGQYVRKGMLLPLNVALIQTTQAYMWELVLNPALSGTTSIGTWNAVTDTLAEVNITRTATTGFTGGYTLASGFVSSTLDSGAFDLQNALTVAQLDLTPQSDVLSLLVTTINGSDQTYQGSMTWRSLR